MLVSVVIVSFNSEAVLSRSISSIPDDCEIIVVDNASTDNSVQVAKNLGATVICNAENQGFGTACNIGAGASSGDLLFFLNPDARLKAESLDELVSATVRYPNAGILAPRIINSQGQLFLRQKSILYWTWPWDRKIDPIKDTPVNYVQGSAMLFPRNVFEEIGGFDTNIFLYFEDDDICFRTRTSGYEILYVHNAIVYHEGGKSTAPTENLSKFKEYHSWKSRRYLCRKHGRRFFRQLYLVKNYLRLILAQQTGDKQRADIFRARLKALLE